MAMGLSVTRWRHDADQSIDRQLGNLRKPEAEPHD